jgi:hypothetical protein
VSYLAHRPRLENSGGARDEKLLVARATPRRERKIFLGRLPDGGTGIRPAGIKIIQAGAGSNPQQSNSI